MQNRRPASLIARSAAVFADPTPTGLFFAPAPKPIYQSTARNGPQGSFSDAFALPAFFDSVIGSEVAEIGWCEPIACAATVALSTDPEVCEP